MMRRWLRTAQAGLACGLVFGAAAGARAGEDPLTAMDGRWHLSGSPYFWGAGLAGSVSVKGLPEVPVNASFADVMKHFDIGLLALNQVRRDRLGAGVDLVYLNLGADVPGQPPVVGALDLGVDQRQLTLEGYGFYRLASRSRTDKPAYLDALLGVRYSSTSSLLTSSSTDLESSKAKLDWVDGVVGLKGGLALARKWAVAGRADVAGLGSDFSWQASGELVFRPSPGVAVGLGYRYLHVDYDQGSGAGRTLYRVAYKGPQLRLTFAR